MRPSRSSTRSLSKADSRAFRRLPLGSSASPSRASKRVMLVIQMDSAAWRSSQSTTGRSGTSRINAESTFVSSTIMTQYLQVAHVDPAAPADRSSYLYRKSVPQFAIRVSRSGDWNPLSHCEECAESPLPYCDHGAQPVVSVGPLHPPRYHAQRLEPWEKSPINNVIS